MNIRRLAARRLWSATALLLSLSSVCGCFLIAEPNGDHLLPRREDDPDAPPPTTIRDPDEARDFADALEPRVVGRYGLRTEITSVQRAPVIGDQTVVTTTWGLASIERVSHSFFLEERPCHAESAGAPLTSTEVPDAVPRANHPTRAEAVFREADGAILFDREETASVVGAQLQHERDEDLPTRADDPRVRDSDRDGHEGVTIRLSGVLSGDIYVVQRTRGAYHGKLEGDGRFSGSIFDRSDQTVIGSTSPLLNQNIPSHPRNEPGTNRLALIRLDEELDCDALTRRRASLFP